MTTKSYVTSNVIPSYHKKEKPILKHNGNKNKKYGNDDDDDDDDNEALQKFHERIKRGRCDSPPPVLQKKSRSSLWLTSDEEDDDDEDDQYGNNKSPFNDSTMQRFGSTERRKRGRPRKEDLDKPSSTRRRSSTIGSTNDIKVNNNNNSNKNSNKIMKDKKRKVDDDVIMTTTTTTTTTATATTTATTPSTSAIKKNANLPNENKDDKIKQQQQQSDNDETNDKSKSTKSRPSSYTDPNRIDKAGRTKLFVYTSSGNLNKVKELVSLGADINFKDHAGWVPLHEAALKGQYEIAKFFIERGANVNVRGFDDDTPLHDACSGGYNEVVQLLVDSGADVYALNSDKQRPLDVCEDETCLKILETKMKQLDRLVAQDENGRTILHKACADGDYDEVTSLLSLGANANAEDNKLWTPIHEAAKHGHLSVVKLLVEHGADINHSGYQGNTVLHHACRSGHDVIVHFLIDNGANIHANNDSGKTAYDVTTNPTIRRELAAKIDEEKKQRATSDAIDEITFTTLKQRKPTNKSASQSRPLSREERKIQAIMKSFEALEQQQPKHSQPTRTSRRYNTNSNRASPSIDENMDDISNNNNSNTTTQTELRKKRTKTHKRQSSILTAESNQSSRECSVDLPDSNTNSSTTRSSSKEPTKKVDATKLDPHKKDTSGRTHLHRWAIRGDVDVCKTLLENGADPNVTDHAGYTPLHESSLRGRANVVKLLLENGANVNAIGVDSDTALHDAIDNRHPDVVDILLQFGADPHITNGKGMSAMEIAKELELVDIQRLLKQAIAKKKNNNSNQQKVKNDQSQKNVSSKKNYNTTQKQSRKRRLVLAADLEHSSSTSTHKRHFSDGLKDIKAEPQESKSLHHFDHSMDMDIDSKPTFISTTSSNIIKSNIIDQPMAPSLSEDGPNTPIPTPVIDRWRPKKVKEEMTSPTVSHFEHDSKHSNKTHDGISTPTSPRSPTLSEAMRFLPLYTVQLVENDGVKSSLYVLDLQVGLLLNLSTEKLWKRYPNLPRRDVTLKEKERLWSPLASMICTQASSHLDLYACDKKRTASVMARHKDQEKQRFLDMPLYFVQLDPMITLIKHDYSYLSKNLITITLDMGYRQDQNKQLLPTTTSALEKTASSLPISTTISNINTKLATNLPSSLSSPSPSPSQDKKILASSPSSPVSNVNNITKSTVPLNSLLTSKTPLKKRPTFGLPPKFAMKMQKHLMYNNNNNDNNNNNNNNQ
ncbi:unnamed protein product [Cunninghamella echinulata]